MTSHMMEIAKE